MAVAPQIRPFELGPSTCPRSSKAASAVLSALTTHRAVGVGMFFFAFFGARGWSGGSHRPLRVGEGEHESARESRGSERNAAGLAS